MTRNQARALLNLPPVPGGDKFIVPLNVSVPRPEVTSNAGAPSDKRRGRFTPPRGSIFAVLLSATLVILDVRHDNTGWAAISGISLGLSLAGLWVWWRR